MAQWAGGTMKVRELLEIMKDAPPDALVFFNGDNSAGDNVFGEVVLAQVIGYHNGTHELLLSTDPDLLKDNPEYVPLDEEVK